MVLEGKVAFVTSAARGIGLSKEELTAFIWANKPKEIDCIAPMGISMGFKFTWDGYDLIRQLSRKVVIV